MDRIQNWACSQPLLVHDEWQYVAVGGSDADSEQWGERGTRGAGSKLEDRGSNGGGAHGRLRAQVAYAVSVNSMVVLFESANPVVLLLP